MLRAFLNRIFGNQASTNLNRLFGKQGDTSLYREPTTPIETQLAYGGVKLIGAQLEKITQLPANMNLTHLDISDSEALRELPPGLVCEDIVARSTRLELIPPDIKVSYRLDLSGSNRINALPDGLRVDYLLLRNCLGLQALPEDLDVYWLDISGCTSLNGFPATGTVRGRFVARRCNQFRSLPPWLRRVSELDVRGWRELTALPEDLVVLSSLDIGGTAITTLPVGCREARLRWNGVTIDENIAFHPEFINVDRVLSEVNVELRRVLIERMGYDRFMLEAQAQVIDKDKDTRGGERRLMRVPIKNDEDLVCVSVTCPSTGRNYMLRVPPRTTSCKAAVAWICGFDNPNDFQPLQET